MSPKRLRSQIRNPSQWWSVLTILLFSISVFAPQMLSAARQGTSKVDPEIRRGFIRMAPKERNDYISAIYGGPSGMPPELRQLQDFEKLSLSGKLSLLKAMNSETLPLSSDYLLILSRDAQLFRKTPVEGMQGSLDALLKMVNNTMTDEEIQERRIERETPPLQVEAKARLERGLAQNWNDKEFVTELTPRVLAIPGAKPTGELLVHYDQMDEATKLRLRPYVEKYLAGATNFRSQSIGSVDRLAMNSLLGGGLLESLTASGSDETIKMLGSQLARWPKEAQLTPANQERIVNLISTEIRQHLPTKGVQENTFKLQLASRFELLDRALSEAPELMTPMRANQLINWCETLVRLGDRLCTTSTSGLRPQTLALASKTVYSQSADSYVDALAKCLAANSSCVTPEIANAVPPTLDVDQAKRLAKSGKLTDSRGYSLAFLEATQDHWSSIADEFESVLKAEGDLISGRLSRDYYSWDSVTVKRVTQVSKDPKLIDRYLNLARKVVNDLDQARAIADLDNNARSAANAVAYLLRDIEIRLNRETKRTSGLETSLGEVKSLQKSLYAALDWRPRILGVVAPAAPAVEHSPSLATATRAEVRAPDTLQATPAKTGFSAVCYRKFKEIGEALTPSFLKQ